MKRVIIPLLLGLLTLSTPLQAQDTQEETQDRSVTLQRTDDKMLFYKVFSAKTEMELDAADLKYLLLETGAGKLEVVANDKPVVEVEALITVSGKNIDKAYRIMDDYMELGMERIGNKIELVSKFDFEDRGRREVFGSGGFFKSPYRKIDLYVKVPAGIAIKVVDGSGNIFVDGIANDLQITDGSGSISVKRVVGNININDNSGDLYLSSINENALQNTVRINDNSGGIVVRKVSGSVFVRDTSGGVDINSITGSLTIVDTSGGLLVRGVDGDLTIDDTSGEINSRDINGFVTVDDSSGAIYVDHVTEGVYVANAGSGQLRVTNNQGKLRGDLRRLNR